MFTSLHLPSHHYPYVHVIAPTFTLLPLRSRHCPYVHVIAPTFTSLPLRSRHCPYVHVIAPTFTSLFPQPVCEVRWQKTMCGGVITLSRQCRQRDVCRRGSYSKTGVCEFSWKDMRSRCQRCEYGEEWTTYKCAALGECRAVWGQLCIKP